MKKILALLLLFIAAGAEARIVKMRPAAVIEAASPDIYAPILYSFNSDYDKIGNVSADTASYSHGQAWISSCVFAASEAFETGGTVNSVNLVVNIDRVYYDDPATATATSPVTAEYAYILDATSHPLEDFNLLTADLSWMTLAGSMETTQSSTQYNIEVTSLFPDYIPDGWKANESGFVFLLREKIATKNATITRYFTYSDIYVQFNLSAVSGNTPTPANTPTPTNTASPTPVGPTYTPTETYTPSNTFTASNTPTDTPTNTNTPTHTHTPTPTHTPTVTNTPTVTQTPVATSTRGFVVGKQEPGGKLIPADKAEAEDLYVSEVLTVGLASREWRYWRIWGDSWQAEGGTPDYRMDIEEWYLWNGAGTNVANTLGTASASSFTATYPASQVNDNDVGTRWLSETPGAQHTEQWVQIDLGVATEVVSSSIEWETTLRVPTHWRLQASDDGSNWLTVRSWGGYSYVAQEEIRGTTRTFADSSGGSVAAASGVVALNAVYDADFEKFTYLGADELRIESASDEIEVGLYERGFDNYGKMVLDASDDEFRFEYKQDNQEYSIVLKSDGMWLDMGDGRFLNIGTIASSQKGFAFYESEAKESSLTWDGTNNRLILRNAADTQIGYFDFDDPLFYSDGRLKVGSSGSPTWVGQASGVAQPYTTATTVYGAYSVQYDYWQNYDNASRGYVIPIPYASRYTVLEEIDLLFSGNESAETVDLYFYVNGYTTTSISTIWSTTGKQPGGTRFDSVGTEAASPNNDIFLWTINATETGSALPYTNGATKSQTEKWWVRIDMDPNSATLSDIRYYGAFFKFREVYH